MFITLLLDNQSGGAPDDAGALAWKTQFNLQNVHVFSDPNFSMVPGSSVGTPQLTVIDPVTMQVTHLHEGFGGDANFTELEALAAQNAGL